MVSLVWLAMLPAVAAPNAYVETEEKRGTAPEVTDPCLAHHAVRACDVLQLAVHTERGSFDAFVFSMHHAQAGVFWFQDRESGEFLRVVAPHDGDVVFLGEGWTAITADGTSYRMDGVLRETYVLRRSGGGEPLAQN